MGKKIKRGAELAWLFGIILCPLGVCLSAKSGLGVSMVVAPAYVLYLKLSQYLFLLSEWQSTFSKVCLSL